MIKLAKCGGSDYHSLTKIQMGRLLPKKSARVKTNTPEPEQHRSTVRRHEVQCFKWHEVSFWVLGVIMLQLAPSS